MVNLSFIIKIQGDTSHWEGMSLLSEKIGNFYIIISHTWTYELLYKLFYT